MSIRDPRRLALALWLFAAALFGAGIVIHLIEPAARDPNVPAEHSTLATTGFLLFALALPTLGAFIAARLPSQPTGWLLCVGGLSELVRNLTGSLARLALVAHPGELPLGNEMLWLSHQASGLFLLSVVLAFFFFPDGRLPSSRWRPVIVLAVAIGALHFVISAPAAWTAYRLPNPYAIQPGGDLLFAFARLLTFVSAGTAVPAAASVVVRYRHSHQHERLQIKWVAAGCAVATVTFLAFFLSGGWAWAATLGPLEAPVVLAYGLGISCLPLSFGLAMFRYHLYDIDVLINRTLMYGATSVTLLALYAVIVLVAQALLRPVTQGSEIAVAASTLAVASLIQPVGRRVQTAVDRRFYRSHYDAARTLDAFGARLRHEVDLEALRFELLAAVRDTMRPAHASVWLREP